VSHNPIAYTYEADTHCYACTIVRFPTTYGTDREDNEVGALFSWDEWCDPDESGMQYLMCGTCMGVIQQHYHDPRGTDEQV
jgi:hypothetical protein